MHRFDAEIVTHGAALRQCNTRVCASIPHHVNLDCKIHNLSRGGAHRRMRIGLVGQYINYDAKSLGLHPDDVVTEGFKLCRFYDAIDIAISWRKSSNNNLPQERFTNPIYFNIPTIGHSFHTSYTEYEHGRPFLCSTLTCLHDTIRTIRNQSLDVEFAKLREEVVRDVHPTNVGRLYLGLFDQVRRKFGMRRSIAPLR